MAQLAKGGLYGEWAGVDSGRWCMQRELELAQLPASIAQAEAEMLQDFVLLGAQQVVLVVAALMDQPFVL